MTTLEVINLNTNLIYKIAKKFYNVDLEDLYQVGVVGILKAYNNYQKNGTTKFSTYAYDYIYGEMYNLVNSNNNYKVSKDLIRLYKKIELTRYTLAQEYGRIPTNLEISKYLNIELSLVSSATNIGNTISFDEDNDNSRNLSEMISVVENISLDDKLILEESINSLSDEEKKIIMCRYYEDLSQMEVAKKLKLSQAKVSRYEKRSIEKMKAFNQK
ncbi:MAG: sigma-70 family RNA polymerase sigma factor [Firmicutes bacterium]|nr:sigma-70 family RNA polymerase sigma factor [Bacillota bacterium]